MTDRKTGGVRTHTAFFFSRKTFLENAKRLIEAPRFGLVSGVVVDNLNTIALSSLSRTSKFDGIYEKMYCAPSSRGFFNNCYGIISYKLMLVNCHEPKLHIIPL